MACLASGMSSVLTCIINNGTAGELFYTELIIYIPLIKRVRICVHRNKVITGALMFIRSTWTAIISQARVCVYD